MAVGEGTEVSPGSPRPEKRTSTSRNEPQRALVELLEEVGTEKEGQKAIVDPPQDCLLFLVGERRVTGAVELEELGGLVTKFVLRGGIALRGWRDLVAAP